MTSNPQSRRTDPSPSLSPLSISSLRDLQIISEINARIASHELRVSLISTLIGIPLLLINLLLFVDLYRKFSQIL